MFTFIRNIVEDFVLPKVQEDKSNLSAFYAPISDVEQKSFCLNYGGYPRNDINKFLEAESIQVAEALSKNLIERQSSGISDKVASDSQLILASKSRYAQTPSELVAHTERLLEVRDSRLIARQQEINFEKSLKERDALRKSIGDSLTNEERDYYLKAKRTKEIDKLIDD